MTADLYSASVAASQAEDAVVPLLFAVGCLLTAALHLLPWGSRRG